MTWGVCPSSKQISNIFLFSIVVNFENSENCYFRLCESALHSGDQELNEGGEPYAAALSEPQRPDGPMHMILKSTSDLATRTRGLCRDSEIFNRN